MTCHDYEEGAIYTCEKCGFEIKIIKTCQDCCGEHDHSECECNFECCGMKLVKKE